MYERFFIFHGNHLLNNRLIHNKHSGLLMGELTIPTTIKDIKEFIIKEINWFENFINSDIKKDIILMNNIKVYLFKGLLSILYKFLKGVISHISIMDKEVTISNL